MNRLRAWLPAVAGPHVFGWGNWVVLLLVAGSSIGFLAEGSESASLSWHALLSGFIAWLVLGIYLLLARQLRRLPRSPRAGAYVLAAYVIEGILGGLVISIGLATWESTLPSTLQPSSVMSFTIIACLALGISSSLALDWRDRLESAVAISRRRIDRLERTRLDLDERIVSVAQSAITAINNRLRPELADFAFEAQQQQGMNSAWDRLWADRLESLARQQVRDISHLLHPLGVRLANQPASEGASGPSQHASWWRIPVLTTRLPWLWIVAAAIPGYIAVSISLPDAQWRAAVMSLVALLIGLLAIRLLCGRSFVVTLTTATQWAIFLPLLAAVSLGSGWGWGMSGGQDHVGLAWAQAVWVFVIGLLVTSLHARAENVQAINRMLQLQELTDAAAGDRHIARAEARMTHAAEFLHSTVQSRLLGIAGLVSIAASESDVQRARRAAEEILDESLPFVVDLLMRTDEDMDERVDLLDSWPEVALSVEGLAVVPDDMAILVNGLLHEAVANAVHHGRAQSVDIVIEGRDSHLDITVDDDGTGITSHVEKGLGLTVVDEQCSMWSLDASRPTGARLTMRVPLDIR